MQKIVDIDNAFLNGDLEYEIYITMPEVYAKCVEQVEENEALKLEKANLWIGASTKAIFQENLRFFGTSKIQIK